MRYRQATRAHLSQQAELADRAAVCHTLGQKQVAADFRHPSTTVIVAQQVTVVAITDLVYVSRPGPARPGPAWHRIASGCLVRATRQPRED